MNSHVALYLAEARHAELRNTAARARAARTASAPSWLARFSAGAVRRKRQVVASRTRAVPVSSKASTIV